MQGAINGDMMTGQTARYAWVHATAPDKSAFGRVDTQNRYVLDHGDLQLSYDVAMAEWNGKGAFEGSIDARIPFIAELPATVDWELPSLALSDASCAPPGVCSLTVDGGGWLPDSTVDLYLVQFEKSPANSTTWLGGHPVIMSPDMLEPYANQLIASIPTDGAGRISGAVEGQMPQPWPIIAPPGTAYSFNAVQHVDNVFKVAQPRDELEFPEARVRIVFFSDGTSQVEVVGPSD
jgi:hypothetical protein